MIYGIGGGLILLFGVLAYAFFQKAKAAGLERDSAKATNTAWKNMYNISKEVSQSNVSSEDKKKKQEEIKQLMKQLELAKEGEEVSGDPFGLNG